MLFREFGSTMQHFDYTNDNNQSREMHFDSEKNQNGSEKFNGSR